MSCLDNTNSTVPERKLAASSSAAGIPGNGVGSISCYDSEILGSSLSASRAANGCVSGVSKDDESVDVSGGEVLDKDEDLPECNLAASSFAAEFSGNGVGLISCNNSEILESSLSASRVATSCISGINEDEKRRCFGW